MLPIPISLRSCPKFNDTILIPIYFRFTLMHISMFLDGLADGQMDRQVNVQMHSEFKSGQELIKVLKESLNSNTL